VAFSESAFRRALLQEQRFSIYQSNKILKHAGYEYKDLFSSSPFPSNGKQPYREKTNAFCYYVIKSIILWNLGAFIEWCRKNNKPSPIQFDQNNIAKYCDFVEDLVKRKNKSYECAFSLRSSCVASPENLPIPTLALPLCPRSGIVPVIKLRGEEQNTKNETKLEKTQRKTVFAIPLTRTLRMTSIDPKWY